MQSMKYRAINYHLQRALLITIIGTGVLWIKSEVNDDCPNDCTVQSQKAVSSYFTSKQILPFWLCRAVHNCITSLSNMCTQSGYCVSCLVSTKYMLRRRDTPESYKAFDLLDKNYYFSECWNCNFFHSIYNVIVGTPSTDIINNK